MYFLRWDSFSFSTSVILGVVDVDVDVDVDVIPVLAVLSPDARRVTKSG